MATGGQPSTRVATITDGTHTPTERYKDPDWNKATYSGKKFVKLHIMHALHGMACAAVVTPGKSNDSPYLRAMMETLPKGDGDVSADAACGGVKNCNAIRDSDRRAVIDAKSNSVIRGFNARAEMLRLREEHPGTFYRILRLWNNVESAFSSMKARFGGVVRALKEKIQSAELLSTTVSHVKACKSGGNQLCAAADPYRDMGFEPFHVNGDYTSCSFSGLRALTGDCSLAACQPKKGGEKKWKEKKKHTSEST